MRYRAFGRAGWKVSEVGYGMWGVAGWTGSDDEVSSRCLERALALGCNFFDTALSYGEGHSEKLLGQLLRAHPERKLYAATKIPPKNLKWPSRPDYALDQTFPADHMRRCVETSLRNLGLEKIDLVQFHVWEDTWAQDARWHRAVDDLKREGLVERVGISANRWEPGNCIRALQTGLIDAVQVIYNIFDQNPEDELLPMCRDLKVAVIARVPYDEGSLTGSLSRQSMWPEGDWRNTYFVPENLNPSVERAEALRPLLPTGVTMAEMALRFVLSRPDVSTVIPGMRTLRHVEENIACSEAGGLPPSLLLKLGAHRWDRKPAWWSQ